MSYSGFAVPSCTVDALQHEKSVKWYTAAMAVFSFCAPKVNGYKINVEEVSKLYYTGGYFMRISEEITYSDTKYPKGTVVEMLPEETKSRVLNNFISSIEKFRTSKYNILARFPDGTSRWVKRDKVVT